MSATTTEPTAPAVDKEEQPAPRDRSTGSLLWAAMGSEWTKLRSVRSTVYSLFATIAITVGFGALLFADSVAIIGALLLSTGLAILIAGLLGAAEVSQPASPYPE